MMHKNGNLRGIIQRHVGSLARADRVEHMLNNRTHRRPNDNGASLMITINVILIIATHASDHSEQQQQQQQQHM
jgi:hypothetical protein